jgi:hypothetical protein
MHAKQANDQDWSIYFKKSLYQTKGQQNIDKKGQLPVLVGLV